MNSSSQDSISISRSISPSPPKHGHLPQREGVLYGKIGICFPWKQLYIKARTTTLHINEGVPGGDLFTVNINDYHITWQEKLQEKYTVVMKNRSDNLADIRWLYLGADDRMTAYEWYQYFMSVADHPPTTKHDTMGRQNEDISTRTAPRGRAGTEASHSKGGSPPYTAIARKTDGMDSNKSPNKDNFEIQEYNEQDLVDTGVEDDYSAEGGDFMLPEEAPEWVQRLFGEHVANRDMWKDVGHGMPKGAQWEIVANDSGKILITVGNLISDRQVFRCEYSFRRCSAQMIVKALLDAEKKTDWDSNVEVVRTLFYTPTTKQSILQQVNKSQGTFQLKREFVYMRYIFNTQNTYFIMDKSQNSQNLIGISKELICRGHIEYSIMRIIEKDDRTYLTQLIKMTNGGLLTTAQDSKMTLSSLVNIKHIERILPLYMDEDDSDLVLIPCPRREEKSRWKQMMLNRSNKKKVGGTPHKYLRDSRFYINIAGINKDGYTQGRSNRSKSEVKTYRTEEENLQEEDIDEKILVLKNKKQDMWEIELSTSSKQVSPDFLGGFNRDFI